MLFQLEPIVRDGFCEVDYGSLIQQWMSAARFATEKTTSFAAALQASISKSEADPQCAACQGHGQARRDHREDLRGRRFFKGATVDGPLLQE